jgi:hypothetical protein
MEGPLYCRHRLQQLTLGGERLGDRGPGHRTAPMIVQLYGARIEGGLETLEPAPSVRNTAFTSAG